MRWTLALVPLLMLSGCLGAQTDDDPRTSESTEEADDVDLRKGVVFHNEEYQVLPNEPLEFDVRVPEGAQNVRIELSQSGAATPLDQADVHLSGCGGAYLSWATGTNIAVSISVLGGSWRGATLCAQAGAGERTVNIDSGATPLRGRVLLRADLTA